MERIVVLWSDFCVMACAGEGRRVEGRKEEREWMMNERRKRKSEGRICERKKGSRKMNQGRKVKN